MSPPAPETHLDHHRPSSSVVQRFPPELRQRIADLADRRDAYSLALVSSAWRDVGESIIWRALSITPRAWTFETLDDVPASIRQTTPERMYTRALKGLRAHPRRTSHVRTVVMPVAAGTETQAEEILRSCTPSVVSLHLVGTPRWKTSERIGEERDEWYETVMSGSSSGSPPDLSAVKHLRLDLGPTWTHSLCLVLERAINVEELTFSLSIPLTPQPKVDWPTLPKLRKLTAPLLGTDCAAFAERCVTDMAPRLTEFAIVELYAPEDHAEALATILRRQGLRIASFPPQLQVATSRKILEQNGSGESDIEELSIEPLVSVPLARSCSPRKHAVKLESRQELTARLAPISSSRSPIYPSCAASPPNVRTSSSRHSWATFETPKSEAKYPLSWPAYKQANSHLGQIRLDPGLIFAHTGIIKFSVCILDLFTFANGMHELHHIALRVTNAVHRFDIEARRTGQDPDGVGNLEGSNRAYAVLARDMSAYAWRADTGTWVDDPQLSTMEVAVARGRVVPETIWREMYRRSGVEDILQGDGRRDLELSEDAWKLFAEWQAHESSGRIEQ